VEVSWVVYKLAKCILVSGVPDLYFQNPAKAKFTSRPRVQTEAGPDIKENYCTYILIGFLWRKSNNTRLKCTRNYKCVCNIIILVESAVTNSASHRQMSQMMTSQDQIHYLQQSIVHVQFCSIKQIQLEIWLEPHLATFAKNGHWLDARASWGQNPVLP